MANHAPSQLPRGFEDHKSTYEGFLKASIALSIICGFILVALCSFRFIDNWNVLIGFGGLIAGILAVLIDLRSAGKWYISGGLLALFGLFVAANL